MNLRLAAIVLAVLLAVPHPDAAASPSAPEPMRVLLRQGVEKAFNLDFLGAEALFRKAVDLDREDPTGYAFLAVNRLFAAEMSYDAREREANREAMLRFVDEALRRGEARIEQNPRDGRAHFAMALARTVKFRWAQRQRQHLAAAQEAYGLWSCLERAQQEDPANVDSFFLSGLVRYHIDHLPEVARFFSSLVVTRGDRERGLRELERAAAKGDLLRELAQSELISVWLNFERQPARALPIARELQRRYPRNYNFSFALANVLSESGRHREALAVARDLERGIAAGRPPFVPQLKPRHDQLMGRIYFNQGDYVRAEEALRRALQDPSEAHARVRAWSYVRLGMIHDARGEREQAVACYELALGVEGGEGIARVEARKHLAAPYVPPQGREKPAGQP
ncbi:MAG: tetratricopeptide repeat protein [Syntrophaceae bacterium]|nr:tetratricopeptide repeat protein [Syntrophaceae bacterium]